MTDLKITNRSGRPTLSLFGNIGRKLNKHDVTPAAVSGYLDAMRVYNETGSLRIYEPIDHLLGIDAEKFAADLDALGPVEQLDLYINSPGGNVFDGLAIYSILNRHPARKVVHIDGLAASISSVIAMVGDRIEISEPAKMMVHNASGIALGDANDMRELADLLDLMSSTIANIYAMRSGQSQSVVQKWMDAETWFSAGEAVKARLADVVVPLKTASNDHRPPQADIERTLRKLEGADGPSKLEVAARLRELRQYTPPRAATRKY